MIGIETVPACSFAVSHSSDASGLFLYLSPMQADAPYVSLHLAEPELAQLLRDHLYEKFRHSISSEDGRGPRIAALLWLRTLLAADGRFAPPHGADKVEIVGPERNQKLDFAV